MKDGLDKQPRFSRVGVIVALAILLVVGAAVVQLLQKQRKVEDIPIVTTTSGKGTTATYEVKGGEQASFTTSPSVIQPGAQDVVLEWDFSGAESVQIVGLPGSFTPKGKHILQRNHELLRSAPPEGATFTAKARMKDGSEREATAAVRFIGKFVKDIEGRQQ